MTPVGKLEAAIKRLGQVKAALGFMAVGADPTELYAHVEEDTDTDGNLISYGCNITGADSDADINEALVTLHRTIDAQLAVLWHCRNNPAEGTPGLRWQTSDHPALALADAILGGA